MPAKRFSTQRIAKIGALAASLVVALGVGEIALRLTKKPGVTVPRGVPCAGCSYIYELDPRVPSVGSHRLRDREFSPAPEEGVFRVLVLGDSLPYGFGLAPEQSFPKVLEKELAGRHGRVEVINAGIPGYQPYNEWRYYVEKGAALHPNLVILSFCMNDVVDPALHWGAYLPPEVLDAVPEAAIPDLEHHRRFTVPALHRTRTPPRRSVRLLSHFELFKLWRRATATDTRTKYESGGRSFPAALAGEDSTSMETLTRYDSAEWTWLRTIYDQLGAAVTASHASLAIMWNPVSYQLDPTYPLHPEELFARYCREHSLPCLDVLPVLREHRAEQLYLGTPGDIWHYNPAGHRIAAHALAGFLEEQKLLPPAGAR